MEESHVFLQDLKYLHTDFVYFFLFYFFLANT